MADAAERQLKILLKLAADVAGAAPLKAELKAIETQAASTNAAVNASTTAGAAATQQRTQFAGVLAAEETKVSAELLRQNAIESQLQVIAATRLELAEAITNGERGQAELLRGELGIRQATLGVMRAEALTQAEMNKLSANEEALLGKLAQNAAATAAGSALAGANLNKAKGEAITLARELATGGVNARTIGAFLGSLGTTLTIGGVAGFALGEIISHLADDYVAFNKELDKSTVKLDEQAKKWSELARDAKDTKDLRGLTAAIVPELNQLAEKMRELREQEVTGWKYLFDTIISGELKLFGVNVTGPFTKQQEDAKHRLQILDDAAILRGHALIEIAKENAAEWERVKVLPVAEAIGIYANKLDDLRAKQNAVDTATKAGIEQYDALAREIGEAEEKLRLLQARTRETTQFEAARISELRQQQELINSNPLLGADAKNEQLHNLYLKERTTLLSQIIVLIALIKQLEESGSDEKLIGPLRKELQDVNFEVDKLSFKLKETGSFSDQLGVGLVSWVNAFGTAAQQVSGLIEGSINAALQGTNQLILDAAFRTGDWRQTLIGVERQIGSLFLTMLEKMALQQAASLLGITTTTGAQVASGGAIAAAHAPAAAATSISSFGAAALIGEVAAIAAIVAIMAALGGGFKKGGFTGHGGDDDYAGPAHKNEFVFNSRATRNLGADNLYALMHAAERAPRFGAGGHVYENTPPWTTGRYGGLYGPTADSGFYNSRLNTRFTGGIAGDHRSYTGPVFDPDLSPEAFGIWTPQEPVIPIEPGDLVGPGAPTRAPVITWVDDDGLPHGPGIDENAPSLFGPSPQRPSITIIPGPSPGSISTGGRDIANFGGISPFGFFSPWSDLGFGVRPGIITIGNGPGYQSGVVETNPNISNQQLIDEQRAQLGLPPQRPRGGSSSGSPGGIAGGGSPVSGGSIDRFAPNSGTGNWIADQTTNAFVLSGGYAGRPNVISVNDEERIGFQQFGTRGNLGYGQGARAALLQALYLQGIHTNIDPNTGLSILPWLHAADGMRLPGPASRADNILAWLSTGERVVPADRNIAFERAFGFDWDKRLELSMPRLADGGVAGSRRSAAGSQTSAAGQGDVHVFIFNDERAARRAYEESPAGRKYFKRELARHS